MKGPNIFLIGPMGAGKTTIGRRLASVCGLEFIDSDIEIEARTGVDVNFIFEKEGEDGFRRREAQAIEELTRRSDIVLATGGGAVLDAHNRSCLAARGFVVYLYASIDQQVARTERAANRPLLATGNRRDTLSRLLAIRDPLYREIADFVLPTDGRNARALVREICTRLPQAVAQAAS